jgi:uroporphyrinogen decarboxylase
MKNLLIDYYRNPGLADRLAKMVMGYKRRMIERAIDMGADVILTGDDYCNRTGPIMSVKHFGRFVLPYLSEAAKISRKRDIPFVKHTDGNIWPIFDQMVKAGINAIDPLEPIAGMDIGKVKEIYGDRICLMGNIDCGKLLSSGPRQDVVDSVRETIRVAAPGGGYVLASSNSIHPAVRPENYLAMVKAGRRYGRYPLQ